MLIVSECMVTITHSDWHSTNERKFRIDLKGNNDFKLIVNAMKKHTRLAKKEIIGDVTIDFAQIDPLSLENGLVKIIDHKRFIVFEGFKVNKMLFNQQLGIFESKEVLEFDSLYKITNYIFNDIHIDLNESSKALKNIINLKIK